jgi:5-carboxymethyl-2-hydroxymuconate isomerase
MLPTQIENCKSRIVKYDDYLLAGGDINNAFVHVAIGVLSGRTEELLKDTANIILEKLKIYFKDSAAERNLQITISITNLPNIYLKA